MSKTSEKLTAREFVWEHRIRQRIVFERIILQVGSPREQSRAQQFLEAMAQANPELLEDNEQYALDLYYERHQYTPELFEDKEYSKPRGRQTALKLPRDVAWEERAVHRAAREYMDLFHPCDKHFDNAMKGLLYLKSLHPKLFAKARTQAVAQREQILTFDIYCKCNCASKQERQAAASFQVADRGRFKQVSGRISRARQYLAGETESRKGEWQFFLDRIGEVAPEMLA